MAAFARQVRGTLEEGVPAGGGRFVRISIPPRSTTRISQTGPDAVQY
jgi:hypothetical protein